MSDAHPGANNIPNPNIVSAPHTLDEYLKKYSACKVEDAHLGEVKSAAGKIQNFKDQYDKVETATGVPWWVVGCIHYRESDLDFSCHLHNGDPLTARTYHVPAGRPPNGNPPFAWYESAIDALGGEGAHKADKWSVGYALQYMEMYNGLGYRRMGVPSPYLWSFTNQYSSGKYSSDGVYKAALIDKQSGVVALMKALGV